MTREAPTPWERRVIAGCAAGAVVLALAGPLLWRWSLNLPFPGSFGSAYWLGTVLADVPACLALAAVVLTARPPVATAIAVVSGLVTVVVNLLGFSTAIVLGAEVYLRWLAWAVVLGCTLLAADGLARRRRHFTPATGALAGALVALAGALVRLAANSFKANPFSAGGLPSEYFLSVYVAPSLMLVAAGTLAGVLGARAGVRQDSAARG